MGKLVERSTPPLLTLEISNRAKRNALDLGILGDIVRCFGEAAGSGEIRVVVVRGEGDRAFCSGYDIESIPTASRPELLSDAAGNENIVQRACAAIETFPYPVIAEVNGHAFGAGLEIAAAADLRIAAEGAKFCMPPARLGLVYGPNGIRRFVRLVGEANAKMLFFAGRMINTDEAFRIGLVNSVVPRSRLRKEVSGLVEELAANAPLSLAGMKRIFSLACGSWPLGREAAEEIEQIRKEAFLSEDLVEGQAAFLESRPPKFKGR